MDLFDEYLFRGATPYYGYSAPLQALGGLLALLFSLIYILTLYRLISYVLGSIGLYTMAKERGIKNAWFSWVPILSNMMIGELDNDEVVFGKKMVLKEAAFWLPVIDGLGILAVSFGDGLGSLIAFLAWVVYVVSIYRLFGIYEKKHQIAFTVWSVLLGAGVFFFVIRKKTPFDERFPDKEYRHVYAEEAGIKRAEQQANQEIDRQVQEEIAQVESRYALLLKDDLSSSEKAQILKQKDEEIADLKQRGQEAKSRNARIAREFRKAVNESENDIEYANYVKTHQEEAEEVLEMVPETAQVLDRLDQTEDLLLNEEDSSENEKDEDSVEDLTKQTVQKEMHSSQEKE